MAFSELVSGDHTYNRRPLLVSPFRALTTALVRLSSPHINSGFQLQTPTGDSKRTAAADCCRHGHMHTHVTIALHGSRFPFFPQVSASVPAFSDYPLSLCPLAGSVDLTAALAVEHTFPQVSQVLDALFALEILEVSLTEVVWKPGPVLMWRGAGGGYSRQIPSGKQLCIQQDNGGETQKGIWRFCHKPRECLDEEEATATCYLSLPRRWELRDAV